MLLKRCELADLHILVVESQLVDVCVEHFILRHLQDGCFLLHVSAVLPAYEPHGLCVLPVGIGGHIGDGFGESSAGDRQFIDGFLPFLCRDIVEQVRCIRFEFVGIVRLHEGNLFARNIVLSPDISPDYGQHLGIGQFRLFVFLILEAAAVLRRFLVPEFRDERYGPIHFFPQMRVCLQLVEVFVEFIIEFELFGL